MRFHPKRRLLSFFPLVPVAVATAVSLHPTVAQDGGDPVARNLSSHGVIIERADHLGLSPDQRRAVRRSAERAHREISALMPAVEAARSALGQALGKNPVDPGTAAECVDALLDAERAVKQLQIRMLVEANNILTLEQRDLLLREKGGAGRETGVSTSGPPDPVPAIGTPAELAAEVASMREEKVAWRKIDWEHCLIDGLAASRAQGKPLIFWCHIDLPADDKRC